MEKVIKYSGSFSGAEITFSVDEDMNRLKGKIFAARSLADANKALNSLKLPLPKIFVRRIV